MMPRLNFPEYRFKCKTTQGRTQIFDVIRKKWLILTPEEWVRQNTISYLHYDKGYPLSLIAQEKKFRVNKLNKRFDVVCYNNEAQPLLIVECKSPEILINENAMMQALTYNSVIKAPYLMLTNGINHYCGAINFSNGSFSYLKDIPCYVEIG